MPVINLRTTEGVGGRIEFVDQGGVVTGMEGAHIPNVIDIDFFKTNKSFLPIFRYMARHTLLVTEKPDITSHASAMKVMKELYKSPITQVEKVQVQPTDGGKTTNYVIPLITDKGTIEIVVNGAWGVSWRLNKDHELEKSHPTLASCQPEDMSGETSEDDKYTLAPNVLEQATVDIINPRGLADRIRNFVTELLANKRTNNIKPESSMRRLPYNYAGETSVMTFGPEILPDISGSSIRLKFDLGYQHGTKSITIDGLEGNIASDIDGLCVEANEIGSLINQFYPQRTRGRITP